MKTAYRTSILLLLSALVSCGDAGTPDDMLTWLDDPENGLVDVRKAGDIVWSAKYMPSEYLASRYLESLGEYDRALRDSVVASYDNTLCFVMTIAPNAEKGAKGDVMRRGMRSFQEFDARAQGLNFRMKEHVTLRYGGTESGAVISTLENTYGLDNRRNIMVIFARDASAWKRADTLRMVLDDRIFGSGVHRFSFAVQDIGRIPALNIPETHQKDQ